MNRDKEMKTSDLSRKHSISDATFYNWKSQEGMKDDELKRLKELEQENAWLNRIMANQS